MSNELQYQSAIQNFLTERGEEETKAETKDRDSEMVGGELINTVLPSGLALLRTGLSNTGIKNSISQGLDSIEGDLGDTGRQVFRVGRNVTGRLIQGESFKPGRAVSAKINDGRPVSESEPVSQSRGPTGPGQMQQLSVSRPEETPEIAETNLDDEARSRGILPPKPAIPADSAVRTPISADAEIQPAEPTESPVVEPENTELPSFPGLTSFIPRTDGLPTGLGRVADRMSAIKAGLIDSVRGRITGTANRLTGLIPQTPRNRPTASEAPIQNPEFVQDGAVLSRDQVDFSSPSLSVRPDPRLTDDTPLENQPIQGISNPLVPDASEDVLSKAISPSADLSGASKINLGEDMTGAITGGIRTQVLPSLSTGLTAGNITAGITGLVASGLKGRAGQITGDVSTGLGLATSVAEGNITAPLLMGVTTGLNQLGTVGQDVSKGINLAVPAIGVAKTIVGVGRSIAGTASTVGTEDAAVAGAVDPTLTTALSSATTLGSLPEVSTAVTDVADAGSAAIASLASTAATTGVEATEGVSTGILGTLGEATVESTVGDENPVGGLITAGLGIATALAGIGVGIKDLFHHHSAGPAPAGVSFQAGISG